MVFEIVYDDWSEEQVKCLAKRDEAWRQAKQMAAAKLPNGSAKYASVTLNVAEAGGYTRIYHCDNT